MAGAVVQAVPGPAGIAVAGFPVDLGRVLGCAGGPVEHLGGSAAHDQQDRRIHGRGHGGDQGRFDRAGKIELEIVPQGTLAERMRAAGAGVPAFFTATGVGTKMGMAKETREFDGRSYVMERALPGDVALVEAWEADRWGNLTFRESGRNFNPVIAMAAKLTIVQSQHIRELGEIDPDHVVTPGIFVNRVLHVPYGDPSGF